MIKAQGEVTTFWKGAKECKWLLGTGKGKVQESPLGPPEGIQPY